jgi:ubiquinone/menaquinone biosynthesis C-methylase UbiE
MGWGYSQTARACRFDATDGDASFDIALCTVSVENLIQPLQGFKEVGRVLKPGVDFFSRKIPIAIKAYVSS